MVSVEDRPTNLARVVVLPLPNLRSDLIRRAGDGLRFGKPMSCAARNLLNSPCQAATAAEANSVPSSGAPLGEARETNEINGLGKGLGENRPIELQDVASEISIAADPLPRSAEESVFRANKRSNGMPIHKFGESVGDAFVARPAQPGRQ